MISDVQQQYLQIKTDLNRPGREKCVRNNKQTKNRMYTKFTEKNATF